MGETQTGGSAPDPNAVTLWRFDPPSDHDAIRPDASA